MIIIAGHTLTESGTRDAAIKAFSNMLERARKHDGCLDLSISADPLDAERIKAQETARDTASARGTSASPGRFADWRPHSFNAAAAGNFLSGLSNFGPAVRLCREGRAIGHPEDIESKRETAMTKPSAIMHDGVMQLPGAFQ